ncbi:MAG: Ig-like domain-containing protein [Anaerolineae bacterium]
MVASAAGPVHTVTFQEGVSGYAGTVDTYIDESNAGTSYANSQTLRWKGPGVFTGAKAVLIRFGGLFATDGGPIPNGAEIQSAVLTYSVTDTGTDAAVREIAREWTEATTWAGFGPDPGVDDDDYYSGFIATASGGSGNRFVDVTASVRGWSAGTRANSGWVFYYSDWLSDEVRIASSENGIASYHPLLTVTYLNSAPVAAAQSVTVTEDVAETITLAGTDADSDPLTYSVVANPSHGTLSGTAPTLTYTPAADYNGADSFTFKVNDGLVDSATATVSITVTAVNDAPLAVDDSSATDEDTPVTVAAPGLLANDNDVDSASLAASKVSDPAHGSVTVNADGSFTYTPAADWNGSDSFTYKANDGSADSSVATVSITVNSVNDAPVATARILTMNEDGAKDITLTGTDVDGDTLTAFTVVSGPGEGTLSGAAPDIEYTPAANFNGTDSFTFTVSDGTLTSAPATVSITVDPVNDAPVADGDSYSTNEDTTLTVPAAGVLADDGDVDGDSLTAVLVTGVTDGTLALNADGSFVYTPDANYNGTDSFTYKANDGTLDSNTAMVSITVAAVNDAPAAVSIFDQNDAEGDAVSLQVSASDVDAGDVLTFSATGLPGGLSIDAATGRISGTIGYDAAGDHAVLVTVSDDATPAETLPIGFTWTVIDTNRAPVAGDDAGAASEDASLSIDVLANDSDADGDDLEVVAVTQGTNGAVAIAPDGLSVTYTPDGDYNGADSFTYTVSDGSGGTDTGTVNVTVAAVNDAPAAVSIFDQNDAEGDAVSLQVSASDVDADDVLTFSTTGLPGGLSIDAATGRISGTIGYDAAGDHAVLVTVSDDATPAETLAIGFTWTVIDTNRAPVAESQSVTTDEDVAAAITLGGSDADGDELTYAIVDEPEHGSLSGTAPDLTYTPDAGYYGTDSFTFTVSDGSLESEAATVTIEVGHVNHVPTADGQTVTVIQGSAETIVLGGEDSDGDVLTYTIEEAPLHGTLSGTAPNLTYTPDDDYMGQDTFTYSVSDGTLTVTGVTVQIVVEAAGPASGTYRMYVPLAF